MEAEGIWKASVMWVLDHDALLRNCLLFPLKVFYKQTPLNDLFGPCCFETVFNLKQLLTRLSAFFHLGGLGNFPRTAQTRLALQTCHVKGGRERERGRDRNWWSQTKNHTQLLIWWHLIPLIKRIYWFFPRAELICWLIRSKHMQRKAWHQN